MHEQYASSSGQFPRPAMSTASMPLDVFVVSPFAKQIASSDDHGMTESRMYSSRSTIFRTHTVTVAEGTSRARCMNGRSKRMPLYAHRYVALSKSRTTVCNSAERFASSLMPRMPKLYVFFSPVWKSSVHITVTS